MAKRKNRGLQITRGRIAAALAAGVVLAVPAPAAIVIDGSSSPLLNQTTNYTTTGTVAVGSTTDGSLEVSGTNVLTSGAGSMGVGVNGNGYGFIAGASARWVLSNPLGNLDVGVSGLAALDVSGGGRVQAGGNARIGVNETGSGSIYLYSDPSGSGLFNVTGTLDVGWSGFGSLAASGASTITTTMARLGYTQTDFVIGVGQAALADAGTTWTNSGQLTLAHDGTALIECSDGAAMTTATLRSAVGASSLGELRLSVNGSFTSTGKAELGIAGTTQISVAASTLTLGDLDLGQVGQASISAQSGATLNISLARFGTGSGGSGDVLLTDDGTSWTNGGTIVVGQVGFGSIDVQAGADLAIANLTLGQIAGARGAIGVAGGGSTATVGSAYVGYAGDGSIVVDTGGTLTSTGQVSVYSALGTEAQDLSNVTITGSGSRWTCNGLLRVGGVSGTATTGLGKVAVTDEGRIDATQTISVEVLGDLQVSDATLNAAAIANLGTVTQTGGTISAAAIDGSTGVIFLTGGVLTADRVRQNRLSIANDGVAVGTVRIRANGSSNSASTLTQLDFGGSAGAWQGKLDLSDNDLILQATAGTRATVLANTTDRIRTARNAAGGLWLGQGITTSAATAITGLAVLLNDNGSGVPIHDTFDGIAVNVNSILVKYTYNGDADLDGAIDGEDYFRIDAGFLAGGAGSYSRGDFNYDGRVDIDDYFLIDQAYSRQGTVLAGGRPSSVPEPGIAGLFAVGGMLGLRRKRRGW